MLGVSQVFRLGEAIHDTGCSTPGLLQGDITEPSQTKRSNTDEWKNDAACIFSGASFALGRVDDLTTCPAVRLCDRDCAGRVSCRPAVAGGSRSRVELSPSTFPDIFFITVDHPIQFK